MSETIGTWVPVREAFEIADISSIATDPKAPVFVFKEGGDNAIPAEVWFGGYIPPEPYIINGTRNLLFDESMFLGSPDAPLGGNTYATSSDGYSWVTLTSATNAMWPFRVADYAGSGTPIVSTWLAGDLIATPPEGVVKVTSNLKKQNIKFHAEDPESGAKIDRYVITDQFGNRYIMHSSGKDTPAEVAQAFAAAVLPEGWTKEVVQLEEDLVLTPAQGSDGSYHYLVLRDSANNGYHQIHWSGTGSVAGLIEGMPVWDGQGDGSVEGHGRWDDSVHGAGGDDRVLGLGGDDTLSGDAGADTVRGGQGADLLGGGTEADLLDGGHGHDALQGDGGDDSMLGGRGRDLLSGGEGDDTIAGGRGADTLEGGAGDDLLRGGRGADLFVVGAGTGADRIADFGPEDRILLEDGLTLAGFARQDLAGSGVADLVLTLSDGGQVVLLDTALVAPEPWFFA